MAGKVAIIGTGLIGTSMGLALRKSKPDSFHIVGVDSDIERSRKAEKMGALHRHENNLYQAVKDAEVVILAVPVGAILEVMEDIAPSLPDHCIVTDTGSTKLQVMKWAEQALPARVTFIGGHPMAGREVSGPDGARADLFTGAVYCICPPVAARGDAVQAVVGIAELIGAKPLFIDPDEHDSYVALVSHLPIILASALISSSNNNQGWREISRLVSSGYKDTTRLASGDPTMNRDICLSNKEHISHRIDEYIQELQEWKRLINGDGNELGRLFAHVWEARDRIMQGIDMSKDTKASEKIPSATEMLMGTYAKGKLSEVVERWAKSLPGETAKPKDSEPNHPGKKKR